MGREIYVNQPLTSHKIMDILDKNPDLQIIKCPPSIYQRISPKYITALSKLGVEIQIIPKRGRPKKYGEEDLQTIQDMIKEGYSPQEISDTLNIPIKTVYYYNKKTLKKGRKRKYSSKIEEKVKLLYKNGSNAKKISEDLKIPLRSVYDLLKRK